MCAFVGKATEMENAGNKPQTLENLKWSPEISISTKFETSLMWCIWTEEDHLQNFIL